MSEQDVMAGHGQDEVVQWLCGPRMLGAQPHRVTQRLTLISVILMAGDRVFKLKRAVRLPYLDFSSAETRLALCRRELALNRRTAPGIYRAVHGITRQTDGSLALDGPGELVDAVLEMARFDEAGLFENLARNGGLTSAIAGEAARQVARFHAQAAVARRRDGVASLLHVVETAEQSLMAAEVLPRPQVAAVVSGLRQGLERHAALLDTRARHGEVRRCHGDLHLGNICLVDDAPTLFDCLEFDEDMATIDVLYDLAFLLMDLWRHGLHEQANTAFNRYLDEAGQRDGLPLLPIFMALRAAIRAHIAGGRAAEATADEQEQLAAGARQLLDNAVAMLKPVKPVLVAVGGFSGSGKSTVAAGLAPDLGPVPGARVLSSDRIRKHLFNADPLTRLPAAAYESEVSARVYAAQAREARAVVQTGYAVVADAVFNHAASRQRMARAGLTADVPFVGVWLRADEAVLAQRVRDRRHDPSDADEAVLQRQLSRAAETGEQDGWVAVEAGGTIAETLSRAQKAVARRV